MPFTLIYFSATPPQATHAPAKIRHCVESACSSNSCTVQQCAFLLQGATHGAGFGEPALKVGSGQGATQDNQSKWSEVAHTAFDGSMKAVGAVPSSSVKAVPPEGIRHSSTAEQQQKSVPGPCKKRDVKGKAEGAMTSPEVTPAAMEARVQAKHNSQPPRQRHGEQSRGMTSAVPQGVEAHLPIPVVSKPPALLQARGHPSMVSKAGLVSSCVVVVG